MEGVDLAVLSALFKIVPADEVAAAVAEKPTGIYARRIWFLWEWLTGRELDVREPGKVKAVPVLDPAPAVCSPGGRAVASPQGDRQLAWHP